MGLAPTSAVTNVGQLKGKTIGIPSLAGGTIIFLKAALQAAGLNPERDASYIPVGGGYPALEALRRNRVDALFLWDSPFARFTAIGAKLRLLRPDPLPQLGFGYSTNVSAGVLEQEPGLVKAMARALAKSVVFMAAAEPAELVKLHLKVYPENKSSSASLEDDIRVESAILKARLAYMRVKQRVFDRSEKIGDETDGRIMKVRDLLLEGGEIKGTLPASSYFTRQFMDDMNDFDVKGVIKRARAFRA